MKKTVVSLFAGILTLTTIQSTKASILYSTDFDSYANGNLVGQDSWAAFSGAGAKPVQVSGGAITLQQSSGSGEDVDRPLGATMGAGDTWYYSFDTTVTGSSSLGYFATFLQGTGNFEGKLFVAPSTVGSDFVFGVAGSSSTIPTTWATGLSFGTNYKIVVGFNYDTDTATLWVNPTSESSTSISDVGTFQDAATAIAFRQASPTGTANSQTIDNLIVATSFNDIIAPVPEPSTIALAGLGGAACLLAFRRRR